MHGEVLAGDGVVWLHPEQERWGLASPQRFGAVTATMVVLVDDVDAHFRHAQERGFALHLDVPDADATAAAAGAAGADVQRSVQDQPDGTRRGSFVDPFGVRWMVSTTMREVSEDELAAVVEEFGRKGAEPGPVG